MPEALRGVSAAPGSRQLFIFRRAFQVEWTGERQGLVIPAVVKTRSLLPFWAGDVGCIQFAKSEAENESPRFPHGPACHNMGKGEETRTEMTCLPWDHIGALNAWRLTAES